ncbi:hypothetical protein VIGAN_08172400, partial [Vigna angularis var. angularis]
KLVAAMRKMQKRNLTRMVNLTTITSVTSSTKFLLTVQTTVKVTLTTCIRQRQKLLWYPAKRIIIVLIAIKEKTTQILVAKRK